MSMYAVGSFVDASKKSWRSKSIPNTIRKDSDKRDNTTSCDHLISHEPGMIPQITEILTHQKYTDSSSSPTTILILPIPT